MLSVCNIFKKLMRSNITFKARNYYSNNTKSNHGNISYQVKSGINAKAESNKWIKNIAKNFLFNLLYALIVWVGKINGTIYF